MNRFYNRPNPVLLSQEKVNHLPRFGDNRRSGFVSHLSVFDPAAAIGTTTQEYNKCATTFTLSPGERAGVRASHFSQKSLFSHTPSIFRQRMRRSFLQRVKNRVPNALPISTQRRVPEAQFPDALRFQKLGSLRVMHLLPGMPVAKTVQFDREPRFHAEKIQSIFPQWMFAPEFIAVEPAVPQPAPHELFGPSLPLPQRVGAVRADHASSISKNRRQQKIRVNAHPHPGPLPQERENHLPRFVRTKRSGFATGFSAIDHAATTVTIAQPFNEGDASSTLSLGKTVGVRASVDRSPKASIYSDVPCP